MRGWIIAPAARCSTWPRPGTNQYANPVPTPAGAKNRGLSPTKRPQAGLDVTNPVTCRVTIFVNVTNSVSAGPTDCKLRANPAGPYPPIRGICTIRANSARPAPPHSRGWRVKAAAGGSRFGTFTGYPPHLRGPSPGSSRCQRRYPWESQENFGKKVHFEPIGVSGSIPGGFAGGGKALPRCRNLTTPARLRMMGA
jgi:hypothetical protein